MNHSRVRFPNLQQWPNRDPLGEAGFETTRQSDRSEEARGQWVRAEISQGPNLYEIARNNLLNQIDNDGLKYGNPVCGPDGTCYHDFPWDPPRPCPTKPCSKTVCKAACAAAALLANTWGCDFIQKPKVKAACKTAVGLAGIACIAACNLCPDP